MAVWVKLVCIGKLTILINMQQTALNLIAIGIFTITLFSMLGPILHISVLVPTLATVGIMGILTLDTFALQNRGISVVLDVLSGKAHRQRVIHHEAGHFLIAYLLGVPIIDYSLSPLETWRKGLLPGAGGVVLDTETLQGTKELPLILEKLSTVWMGGIAAEQIIYKEAEGGQEDRQQLYATLEKRGLNKANYLVKERLAILEAKSLLQKHRQAYQTLVDLMTRRTTVEECYQALNIQVSQ